MSAILEISVRHQVGGFTLDADFKSNGRLTALFGRSGAGKTTLVNVIAGLIRPDAGRVAVQGEVLIDSARGYCAPMHRRRIGYVFQDARLFPHLSVRQNLLFGRWFARARPGGMGLDQVIALLGVEHLLDRRPHGLSGGEKQRVAIGRALLARPRLLLMDEPLAALDEARKAEILPCIERLRDASETPIIYVSHAVREVARLAEVMAVMDQGRIAAVGPPAALMSRLDLAGLARPLEAGSVLTGDVIGHDAAFALTLVSTPAGLLRIGGVTSPVGARVPVQIPASGVLISLNRLEGISALNQIEATVAEIGAPSIGEPFERQIRLDACGEGLIARLTSKSLTELNLAVGQRVFAIIKSVSINPPDAGEPPWRI